MMHGEGSISIMPSNIHQNFCWYSRHQMKVYVTLQHSLMHMWYYPLWVMPHWNFYQGWCCIATFTYDYIIFFKFWLRHFLEIIVLIVSDAWWMIHIYYVKWCLSKVVFFRSWTNHSLCHIATFINGYLFSYLLVISLILFTSILYEWWRSHSIF